MKKILLILLILCESCAVQRYGEYINVYKRDQSGIILPSYLIIRANSTYDLYHASIGSGVIGTYDRCGDTLCLMPKYEYGLKIKDIDSSTVTFDSVPMQLVLIKNKLYDITDYGQYPELAPFYNPKVIEEYKRIW